MLHVRVPVDGTIKRMSTKIKVPEHLVWVQSKQRFRGMSMDVNAINEIVVKHEIFLRKLILNKMDIEKEYESFISPFAIYQDEIEFDIVSVAKRYLSRIYTGEILTKSGTKMKSSTLNLYSFSVRTLIEYACTRKTLLLLDFNSVNSHNALANKEMADKYHEYWRGFHKYMSEIGLAINTKSSITTIVATILNHFQKEYMWTLPTFPTIRPVDNPIVVLPHEFVADFINDTHKKYQTFDSDSKFIWEVCATILVTTMRVSDVVSLNYKDLLVSPNGVFLSKMNKKTGAVTNMPLPKALTDRYMENMAMHGSIFTTISSASWKKHLLYYHFSKFFAKYKEMHAVVSASFMNAKGEYEMKSLPLYDWVKPHLLRKTAITMMLKNGVSDQHTKFASGHSARSMAFEKYRGFVDSHFNSEIGDYFDKFLK